MNNDGKAYERFVALLYQALLDAEKEIPEQKNVEVQRNKKIVDSCRIEREFDIYWEYELAGITYKTVIECKDYNSKISVEKIDALIGKIRDIPDLKPIFATKTGYQSGAESKAKHNKIDLLVVREQNDSDWRDVDGTPFVKKIHINGTMYMPACITDLQPLFDPDWVKENFNIDSDTPTTITISGMNDEIFIENEDTGERYSVYELARKLTPSKAEAYGEFVKEERFGRGWIVGPDFRYKIKGYDVHYLLYQPHKTSTVIDHTKELIGVVEYLQKGMKKKIFRSGIIRDHPLPVKRQ
uniref:Restriction endonuclease n=1 Tax=Candidatus Kentrum sp. LFY TaxID=2126342 RepID=A0A450V6X6_9GAMM|nr:MAG: Restriction endonuclease [Candidatus Kentron sp. LFY]